MNNLVELENGELEVVEEVKKTIFTIENEIKKLKEVQDKYKKALLEEIEKRGLLKCSIKNDLFNISYTSSYKKETLDSKKIKEEMPEIYDKYVKMLDVKSSVSIKLK